MIRIGVTSSSGDIGSLMRCDMIFADFSYPCIEVAEEEMGIGFVNHNMLL
jgi:hypothetical protein